MDICSLPGYFVSDHGRFCTYRRHCVRSPLPSPVTQRHAADPRNLETDLRPVRFAGGLRGSLAEILRRHSTPPRHGRITLELAREIRQMSTSSRSSWPVRIASRRALHASIIAARDQGVHLPNVKVGFQRLKGQKRTEMI